MTAIKFTARKVADAEKAQTQCAVVPVAGSDKLTGVAKALDKASGGAISATIALGDFKGKSGEKVLLPGVGRSRRLLLIGVGD